MYEMSNLFSGTKINFKLSSAEFAQRVVKVNIFYAKNCPFLENQRFDM